MLRNDIYELLSSDLRLSVEDLKNNGYPYFKDSRKQRAIIAPTRFTRGKRIWLRSDEQMRICCRCETEFKAKNNGSHGSCLYHSKGAIYDKTRKRSVRMCCDEEEGLTNGCKKWPLHVYDQLFMSELEKFVETEAPLGRYDSRTRNIFAIDVEMVYTMAGPALARLSVVNWDGVKVLDVKVKPPTSIIDPNTEYSGLTTKELKIAEETLESCRQKLLLLVNRDTILVGHSLEADLRALRLVHYNVVDTSLLFKLGENKIGLKNLALEHLGIRIQSNNVDQNGHDSEEDAKVCLSLLKYYIRKMM